MSIRTYHVVSQKDAMWHGIECYVLNNTGNPMNIHSTRGICNYTLREVGTNNHIPIHQGEIRRFYDKNTK